MTRVADNRLVRSVAIGLLVGCGGRASTDPAPLGDAPCGGIASCSVAVTPRTATLRAGETLQVTAVTSPLATAGSRWDWTSSDSARIHVDSTGLVRAIVLPTADTAICATLRSSTGLKGCMTIVVPAQ